MSVSNSGPGGVRNLRAMFENKANDQSNSPPSRGRSPNGSVSSLQDAPPGKVRASFVAVEKPGEEGQSQPVLRKPSGSTMSDTNENTIAEEHDLGEILKGSPFLDDGKFSTQPAQEPQSNGLADRAAAMVKKMQQGNTEPLSTTNVQLDTPVKPRLHAHGPAQHTPKPAAEPANPQPTSDKTPIVKGPIAKPKGGVNKIKGVMESAANAQKERDAADKQDKSTEQPPKSAPTTDPTSKPKDERPILAGGVKPKGGVSKIQGVMESARQAREARSAAAGSVPQIDGAEDTVIHSSTSRTPRSSLPTRRAPAPAVAQTTSSVTKPEGLRTGETKPVDKKAVKAPLRVANVTTTASLAKKSSRASLNPNDGTKAKGSTRPADEGFLARMMRPTASSAQKTQDKVQTQSPPRSKQTSGRILASRPSRRSLGQTSENKENETEIPAVPAIPPATEKTEAASPSS